MKDIYELENAVNEYMERHGMKKKKSSRNITKNTYTVDTMNWNYLESKLVQTKDGKTKAHFKVNGKVTSLYK